VGWQRAIIGQLVGTKQIQYGGHDLGKLQNVFIFTLQHATILVHALAYEVFSGTISSIVQLCLLDPNSKWLPYLPPQITKIEHIGLC